MKFEGKTKEELHAFLFGDCDPLLKEKFKTYLATNPHIFPHFERLVARARQMGKKKYSAWVIVNKMRWDLEIEASGDPFRISNDYIALMSRLYVWKHPESVEFFDFKPMKERRTLVSGETRFEYQERMSGAEQ